MADNFITRRKALGYGGAAMAAGLATYSGFGNMAAQAAANELRVLFPGGTWRDYFVKTFTDPFAEKTGTKFIWKTTLNPDPVVIAEKNNPQWDLIHGQQKMSMQLGPMDLLVELTEDRLPHLNRIHPSFRYKYLVGAEHTPYGLAINTSKIKRPITSWLDLWDPEFKGKVGFPRWVWTGQEVFHFVNRILGGDEHNVEKAVSEFQKLFRENDAMITQNVEHTMNLLVEEEIWITPFYSSRTFQAAAKGAPVEFLLNMKEGALSFISNPAIVANRPKESEDLAFKFIDSTLEEEAQINFARATGYPPTNLDAIKNMPDDVAAKVGRFTEEDLAGLGTLQRQFDYTAMFEVSDAMFERWKKEILRA